MLDLLAAALFGALLRCDGEFADAPITPCVETWCTLLQVMDKLREDVTKHELNAMRAEESPLRVALASLRRESAVDSAANREQLASGLVTLGRQIADLRALGDAGEQTKCDDQLVTAENTFETVRSFFGPEILTPARLLADRYTCPMHPGVIGKKLDPCPKCGMPLDQFLRLAPFGPGAARMIATVRATAWTDAPLEIGRATTATIHLSKTSDDSPVTLDDLTEMHTKKIHLLIVDSSLSDYHHEHPQPGDKPGDYLFSFTPAKSGSYRVWADLRTIAGGFQEYAQADLAGEGNGEPLRDRTPKMHAEIDGLRYELTVGQSEIIAGQPAAAKLRVTDSRGAPFTQLEPLMAAYAHLVGFCENGKTVLHMHPRTLAELSPDDRGGPELDFTFFAPEPGFVRLFAQVQVGGVSKFAPFGILVQPRLDTAARSSQENARRDGGAIP